MREIILDTETTGLDPHSGHRLVEIAAIEIVHHVASGAKFHTYLDPERDMPEDAFRVHGLSSEFLRGKPRFLEKALEFADFIADFKLVIHNAEFDIKFLNHELQRAGHVLIGMDRVFDTLTFARRKFPGASNSLDALCARFRIDNSRREKHGALLDAEILAEVYVELMGGRQTTFVLNQTLLQDAPVVLIKPAARAIPVPSFRDQAETQAHRRMVDALGEKALWHSFPAE